MTCELNWEALGVHRKLIGQVRGAELLASVMEVEGDPRFDELRYTINDLSECEQLSVTREDVQHIAAVDYAASRSNPRIRVAVVGSMPQLRELIDLYSQTAQDAYPMRLFQTLEEARVWLRQ